MLKDVQGISTMNYAQMAEESTILKVLVGSQAYGLSLDGGAQSDRDEKGVCIEPYEVFAGFNGFEQYEFRSAVERTGKKDEPSGPGDLDLTIYSLKKFLRLAFKGNPTIIEMLFIKEPLDYTYMGVELQSLYPFIVSKQAGKAYLGYMQAQHHKMLRGYSPDEGGVRERYVGEAGYDTKFAMHMLRLGLQGVELLTSGKLILPLPQAEQDRLLRVRQGKLSYNECTQWAVALEADLKQALDTTNLPEHPDTTFVEKWMLTAYMGAWDWA
jgi:uncharacterized protein